MNTWTMRVNGQEDRNISGPAPIPGESFEIEYWGESAKIYGQEYVVTNREIIVTDRENIVIVSCQKRGQPREKREILT